MDEEKYMRRCIQLAQNGRCNTPPNPMVGAVIVCDGKIIGEGYHARCGQAHAEVNAIRSVRHPELLRRSTIYVSLEPCAHYGKTPPCADLIIEKQIPRIVIGCRDPFARVDGRGIQKLREAGREVVVGVLEDECLRLIERFVTFHTRHRPYVTLKWAESADGFIDRLRNSGQPALLSSPLTQMLVHKRRTEHTAILVGTRTALLDNPRLDVRHWWGPQPVRLVIDRHRKLTPDLHLLDGSLPTLLFTEAPGGPAPCLSPDAPCPPEYVSLDFTHDILPQLLDLLYRRGLQSLLVEGGTRLLQPFIDAGLWDEAFVEHSPLRLGSGVAAPRFPSGTTRSEEIVFGRTIEHAVFHTLHPIVSSPIGH